MQAALEGGAATSRPANLDVCGGGVLLSCVPACTVAGVPSDNTSSSAAGKYFIVIVRFVVAEGSLPKRDGRSSRSRILELHASASWKITTMQRRATKFGLNRPAPSQRWRLCKCARVAAKRTPANAARHATALYRRNSADLVGQVEVAPRALGRRDLFQHPGQFVRRGHLGDVPSCNFEPAPSLLTLHPSL